MKERPILFSAPMVRAILENRKGATRIYAKRGEDRNAPEFIAARLLNGVEINDVTGCWNWKRHRNNYGYGKLRINGEMVYAHRVAYSLAVGEIPAGADLMHRCDNPRCINPEHLVVGSRSDNMKDCHAKGRSRIPLASHPGTKNGQAILTAVEVGEIRRRLSGGSTQAEIASEFGVSQSQISNIATGKRWGWL